jgi:hypothetical protein
MKNIGNRYLRLTLFLIMLCVIGLTCKKPENQVFSGNARIRAVVYYKDATTNLADTAVTAQVTITENSNAVTTYLLTLTNGTFDLSSLSAGSYRFQIIYNRPLPDSATFVHYALDTTLIVSANELLNPFYFTLKPTATTSPTLQITVTDINGYAVSGAEVCLYGDTLTLVKNRGTCAGSISGSTTNSSGIVVFDNLQAKKYFASVYVQKGADTLSNQATDTAYLNKTLLSTTVLNKATIVVAPVYYSLNVTVTDVNGVYVPGTNVCIYSDHSLLAKFRYTCNGSIEGGSTDLHGQILFSGLQAKPYYISAYKIIGTDTLNKTNDTLSNVLSDQSPTPALIANSQNHETIIIK